MARHKRKKFAQNRLRANIIEEGKPLYTKVKGHWNSLYFKNENPIVLELACGRGEYTIGLSEIFPNKNFIGIDIKGDRLWKGSGLAIEKNLKNVAFLRCHILYLNEFFAEHEVSDIWIVFPDPQPRAGRSRHRLTHQRFLSLYQKILKPDGWVRLKTDSDLLYHFTQEVIEKDVCVSNIIKTENLYASELLEEHHDIQTRFEKKWLTQGSKIKYIKFQLS